jgi:hypothetical protein
MEINETTFQDIADSIRRKTRERYGIVDIYGINTMISSYIYMLNQKVAGLQQFIIPPQILSDISLGFTLITSNIYSLPFEYTLKTISCQTKGLLYSINVPIKIKSTLWFQFDKSKLQVVRPGPNFPSFHHLETTFCLGTYKMDYNKRLSLIIKDFKKLFEEINTDSMSPKFIEFGTPLQEILDLCYIIKDPIKRKNNKERIDKTITMIDNEVMHIYELEKELE